jgi:hypothetical protein
VGSRALLERTLRDSHLSASGILFYDTGVTVPTIPASILDIEERFEAFENLMPFRVQNILLVSSLYDSFILRED